MLDVTQLCRWQGALFAESPVRFEILKQEIPAGLPPMKMRVHRNHAFEQVAPVLRSYLGHAGFDAGFVYSDYDDALNFDVSATADVELLWLDDSRYQLDDERLWAWVYERLSVLRGMTVNPVVVPTVYGRERFNELLGQCDIAGVHVAPLAAEFEAVGGAVFDDRRAAVMGTRLNDRGQLLAARVLGANLPAVMLPYVKAVAVDLDHTLYSGVLGEDGIDGLVVSDSHKALQQALVDVQAKGVLLAIVSKNELADVQALFAGREDFVLKAEHISSWQVSWGGKAEGIRAAARAFNIAADAFVLVDDNPGELMAVRSELPAVGLIYSGESARQATCAVRYWPRLWPQKISATDMLRVADIQSKLLREQMAEAATDGKAYLKSLEVIVEFAQSPLEHRQRLAEMCRKTNQFNLSLSRFDEATVARYLSEPGLAAFTMAMRDKLSDSGIIGCVFTRTEGKQLHVDELCMSCRALGRELEDAMIASVLLKVAGEGVEEFVFHYVHGERNGPALEWLDKFAGAVPAGDGELAQAIDRERLEGIVQDKPVAYVWA